MTRAFANPLARRQPGVVASARAIKTWAREILTLSDDVVVSVNELSCALPECPPKETVILVMRPGEQVQQASIHLAMENVTQSDIALAFEIMASPDPAKSDPAPPPS